MSRLLSEVKKQKTKFIVVTGGVCSSIGKGVLISSLGVLLKNSGYSVSVVKWDPYLNVDPGTISPLVHGEVFVTEDGAETDLDLGHYERVLQVNLSKDSSVSSGQIFREILDGERKGKFLGRDIQFVPHVMDAIKNRLFNLALKEKSDFILVEIGGTVGDMEGVAFLESVREMKMDLGPQKFMLCHLSFVPTLPWTEEVKTKPTQHSVLTLKGAGLVPDALFLRADKKIEKKALKKLSVMCGVEQDLIFEVLTFKPSWKVFFALQKQEVNERIQKWFDVKTAKKANLKNWQQHLKLIESAKKGIKVGLVAKYVGSNDPYISVIQAIKSAGFHHKKDIEVVVIEAEKLEKDGYNGKSKDWQQLKSVDGVVIPGGFDVRGVEGKILAVKWAREKKIPYLGLCLGMQLMLVEFARSVLKMKNASSTEFNPKTKYPIISLLEEQIGVEKKGGTMRLGAYPCTVIPNTLASKAYKKKLVHERHRHRYEFNNKFKKDFEKKDVFFSGIYKEKNLVEMAELKQHPFMLGSQFHPEFKSSPLMPHPLFDLFIKTIVK